MALGERMDDEGIRLLEDFAMAYIGGDLTGFILSG